MKKMLLVLMTICGVAIASYGASAVAISRYVDVQTHSIWWAQVLVCLFGGLGLATLPNLKGMFQKETLQPDPGPGPRPRPRPTPTPPTPMPNVSDDEMKISMLEQEDLAALHHLSTRLLEIPEALAMCRQLHDCVFELHHGSLDVTNGGTQLFESSIQTNDSLTTLSRSVLLKEPEPGVLETVA